MDNTTEHGDTLNEQHNSPSHLTQDSSLLELSSFPTSDSSLLELPSFSPWEPPLWPPLRSLSEVCSLPVPLDWPLERVNRRVIDIVSTDKL